MSWPETVDRLTARNIHKGSYGSGRCRCVLGWLNIWFPSYLAFKQAARTLRKNTGIVFICEWNDDPGTSKAEIARALNQLTDELGYTEDA